MSNKELNEAKRRKRDEFYTQKEVIERELGGYDPNYFKGKSVFCNCNDTENSEFWKFFSRKFEHWEMESILATSYRSREGRGVLIERTKKGVDTWELEGDGDFRSPECVEILKESDIAVTNPPFSLLREYLLQLIKYKKKFLVIGSMNLFKTKDMFPFFMKGNIWYGHSLRGSKPEFRVPDDYPMNAAQQRIDENGIKYIQVKGVRWLTNLKHKIRIRPMPLYREWVPEQYHLYPEYDNYDAIEVCPAVEIPANCTKVMGVPISFMDKFCPEQFEIVGLTTAAHHNGYWKYEYGPEDTDDWQRLNANCPAVVIEDGIYDSKYPRMLIRAK